MDHNYLEKLWSELCVANGEYVYRRIDVSCKPELHIGFDPYSNRCLVLELPKGVKVDFQSSIKQNLRLDFYQDMGCIVLKLIDDTYVDLFSDLVLSIYQCINKLVDVNVCTSIFIQTFYKWSEFFDDKGSDRLSIDVIKGLFGELVILKLFVEDSPSSSLNNVLGSWRGPYDQGHDFVFDDKCIEVKTKSLTKPSVRVSSEMQLEPVLDKRLELLVLSVEQDLINGMSIKELVSKIKQLIIIKLGDTSILLKAIRQKGLSQKNLHEYDNYKFNPIKKCVYSCNEDEFPKLVRANLPPEIRNVKYDIHLSNLSNFLLEEVDIQWN